MPRLFVAVDLPDESRRALGALCGALPVGRPVPADQLHVTLRFLGEVPASDVRALEEALASVRAPAVSVALAGLGTFPPAGGRRPARVLWAGLAPGAPLVALKEAIDRALGPDPEAGRGFTPHVTLARFKTPPGPGLAAFIAAHGALVSPPWLISEFLLYESVLSSEGASHTIRRRFALAP